MKSLFLSFILIFSAHSSLASTECIGEKNAKKLMVYLHGMDSISPSRQELDNRIVLEKLAKSLDMRFAIPRATKACPTNDKQICWTWTARTAEDLEPVKKAISSAAHDCFSSKTYSVLGFSNGGTAVASLLRLCQDVDFKLGIVVGAAGAWFSSDPSSLQNCQPEIISMIGSQDSANHKPARDFIAHLVSLKAKATVVEYQGDHSLSYQALFEQLRK